MYEDFNVDEDVAMMEAQAALSLREDECPDEDFEFFDDGDMLG